MSVKSFSEKITHLFSKKIESLIIVDLSSQLKLLNLDLKDKPSVAALKIYDLPPDKKEQYILDSLAGFIKENNILVKSAVLIPDLPSLFIRGIQLPITPEAELAKTIQWQIKDDLGFSVSEAIIDYQVIGTSVKEGGAKLLSIICVASRMDQIKKQVLLLQQAQLKCVAVRPVVFGYPKLIVDCFRIAPQEPVVVLNIEDDHSHLAICKDSRVAFFRSFPVTLNKIKESLSGMLATEKGQVQLTPEQINSVLFETGIPSSGQILAMVRPQIEALVQEIKRSFVYGESQLDIVRPSRLVVCGRAAAMPNFRKILNQELGLEVLDFSSSVPEAVKINPGVDRRELDQNYHLLGPGLDLSGSVNLLPAEFRTQDIEALQKLSLRWISFGAFIFLLLSFLFSKIEVGLYAKRVNNSQLQLTILSQVEEIKAKTDALDSLITQIRKEDVPAGRILKRLSNICPVGIFFNDLSIDGENRSGSITGVIRNAAGNQESLLANLSSAMEASGYFKEVNVSSINKTDTEEGKVDNFQVNFKLP